MIKPKKYFCSVHTIDNSGWGVWPCQNSWEGKPNFFSKSSRPTFPLLRPFYLAVSCSVSVGAIWGTVPHRQGEASAPPPFTWRRSPPLTTTATKMAPTTKIPWTGEAKMAKEEKMGATDAAAGIGGPPPSFPPAPGRWGEGRRWSGWAGTSAPWVGAPSGPGPGGCLRPPPPAPLPAPIPTPSSTWTGEGGGCSRRASDRVTARRR